jgi:hypothetical protein
MLVGFCAPGWRLAPVMAAEAAPWTARLKQTRWDPRRSHCLLTSEPQIASDDYDSTSVALVFNGNRLLVVVESDLDLPFADLQLVVDDKLPVYGDKMSAKPIWCSTRILPARLPLLNTHASAAIAYSACLDGGVVQRCESYLSCDEAMDC